MLRECDILNNYDLLFSCDITLSLDIKFSPGNRLYYHATGHKCHSLYVISILRFLSVYNSFITSHF